MYVCIICILLVHQSLKTKNSVYFVPCSFFFFYFIHSFFSFNTQIPNWTKKYKKKQKTQWTFFFVLLFRVHSFYIFICIYERNKKCVCVIDPMYSLRRFCYLLNIFFTKFTNNFRSIISNIRIIVQVVRYIREKIKSAKSQTTSNMKF